MQNVQQVMQELKKCGTAQTRKIYTRHGAPADQMYGVKIADIKRIAKKLKGRQELAYELYDTGNSDAMYLAGVIVDGSLMTKRLIETWAKAATWYLLSEYTVPGVAVEHRSAQSLALKWIRSKKESIGSSGWATYAGIVASKPDDELDLKEIRELLRTVPQDIDAAPNRVRYAMNGFVISVGGYVTPLLKAAKTAAKKIGQVSVDMGETSCKVPLASEYIEKMESMGRVGRKRKTIKC